MTAADGKGVTMLTAPLLLLLKGKGKGRALTIKIRRAGDIFDNRPDDYNEVDDAEDERRKEICVRETGKGKLPPHHF